MHEDDALRAVRAAQEMQDALPELGLEARIGINTGEVLAGDQHESLGLVAGEPVIIAKRLEQGASTGDIIIGKATYPLVKHAVSAGPLERISMKGKQEEVGRRRVDEVDLRAPSLARRLDLPLVGRDEELTQLEEAFDSAVEEKSCRLYTVLGPPGIGKSRLAAELAEQLSERATAAVGRCLPYGEGITFWPLTEVARSLGDEELERTLAADLPPEETFPAVRRAFEQAAEERPLLVCFEDLHWAEPTLLDLVEYVAGSSRGVPILILALARAELVEQRPSWIAPRANADALALEPLSAGEIENLLGTLDAESALDPQLRERISDAAEGNPLFAEQMAAMAAQNNGGELPIPGSLQGLLAERLDRLTRDERDTVERAAVIGRDFPISALLGLAVEEQRASLTGTLLSLVRKGLVRPERQAAGDEDRFSFQHVLVRDAAYDAMPKELRAELHERLADNYADTAGDALIGYHLERAYYARAEIAPGDPSVHELARRAARRLAAAGKRAEAREDIPAAVNLLERAAVLLVDGTRRRPAQRASARDRQLDDEWRPLRRGRSGSRRGLGALGERRLAPPLAPHPGRARVPHRLPGRENDGRKPHRGGERNPPRARASSRTTSVWRRHGFCSASPTSCPAGGRRAARCSTGHSNTPADPASAGWSPAPPDSCALRFSSVPRPSRRRRGAARSFFEEAGLGALTTLAALNAMKGDFPTAREQWGEAARRYEELGLRFRRASRSLIGAQIELLAGDPQAAADELRFGRVRARGDGRNRRALDHRRLSGEYAVRRRRPRRRVRIQSAKRELRRARRCRHAGSLALCTRDGARRAWRGRGGGSTERRGGTTCRAHRVPGSPGERGPVARARVLGLTGRENEARPVRARAVEIYERKGNLLAARQLAV